MIFQGVDYVFTDGAALANGYANCSAAWAVFFADGDPRNQSARITEGPVSNQVAELTAVSRALELIQINVNLHDHPMVIVTDSKYVLDCLTKWYRQWERNNWRTQKGELVKHQQVIKNCRKHLDALGARVSFMFMKSHRREPKREQSLPWILWYGNNQADKLATSIVSVGKVVKVTW